MFKSVIKAGKRKKDIPTLKVKIPIHKYSKIPKNDKIYSFDKEKYKEYKDKYLKFPGTPEKYLWDVFLDNISSEVYEK